MCFLPKILFLISNEIANLLLRSGRQLSCKVWGESHLYAPTTSYKSKRNKSVCWYRILSFKKKINQCNAEYVYNLEFTCVNLVAPCTLPFANYYLNIIPQAKEIKRLLLGLEAETTNDLRIDSCLL